MTKRVISFLLLTVIWLASTIANAQQQTVGVFVYDSIMVCDGYTLFSPRETTMTYLIDNHGRQVHSWSSEYRPGVSVYLSENGHLVRPGILASHPLFITGGGGGIIQEMDWDGNILWEYEYYGDYYLQHHDIEQLPNGNVLMIAWERKTYIECIAAGRDPSLLTYYQLWPDHVIEVEPADSLGGTIVWEWHLWDHLIQDYDSTKANYGVVGDHPELVDLNYSGRVLMQQGIPDWTHTNSIDYNAAFDQIVLSIHGFSEIWVIDHSTTTEEAAGHTGGNSGKGGDLLYRWGNPEAYRAGTSEDRKFYFQHDAQWVEAGYPGEGNILVFNNGLQRPGLDYSSVDEIVPPVDSVGNYSWTPGTAYEPEEQVWIYVAENPTEFYSSTISGAQRLSNGNTLICDGESGIFFEVTSDTEIVWYYVNPVIPSGPMIQGNAVPVNPFGGRMNNVFKIRRYAPGFPAFQQIHQLIPGDPIELYPDWIDDVTIEYDSSAVTLRWSRILNPLVRYNIYATDRFSTKPYWIAATSDTAWLGTTDLPMGFLWVTFEVAP